MEWPQRATVENTNGQGLWREELSREVWQSGLVLYAARCAVLLLSRYSRKNSLTFGGDFIS